MPRVPGGMLMLKLGVITLVAFRCALAGRNVIEQIGIAKWFILPFSFRVIRPARLFH
jgi:hypothetical protein